MQVTGMKADEMKCLKTFVQGMQEVNSDIKWSFIPAKANEFEVSQLRQEVAELHDKVDGLMGKLDLIFGDHFLLNGKFTQP